MTEIRTSHPKIGYSISDGKGNRYSGILDGQPKSELVPELGDFLRAAFVYLVALDPADIAVEANQSQATPYSEYIEGRTESGNLTSKQLSEIDSSVTRFLEDVAVSPDGVAVSEIGDNIIISQKRAFTEIDDATQLSQNPVK